MSLATAGFSFTENLTCGSATPSYYYNFHRPKQTQSTTHDNCSDYFSNNNIVIDDNPENRNKLIQAATNRLQQKRLEEKYLLLKSHIIELQSKLDIIKLEASISLNSFINNSNTCDATEPIEAITQRHLDHFEKRLENHRLQIQQAILTSSSLLSPPSSSTAKREVNRTPSSSSPKTVQPSLSFSSFTKSSFSSTISSILSPVATRRSSFGEEQQDFYASLNGGSPIFKRRKRYQQQQQQKEEVPISPPQAPLIHPLDITHQLKKQAKQQQIIQDEDDTKSITTSSNSQYAPPSITSYTYKHNISQDIVTPSPRKELLVLHSINDDDDGHSHIICNNCSLCSCSCSNNSINDDGGCIRTSGGGTIKQSISGRNALDDTISFLNDLASDTDDGGFRQELLCLVDNIIRHNNSNSTNNNKSVSSSYNNHSSALAAATSSGTRSLITNQVYQELLVQQQQKEAYYYHLRRHSTSTYHKKKKCFIRRWISTGCKYVRFALVLTLAVMINLSRGPKSI